MNGRVRGWPPQNVCGNPLHGFVRPANRSPCGVRQRSAFERVLGADRPMHRLLREQWRDTDDPVAFGDTHNLVPGLRRTVRGFPEANPECVRRRRAVHGMQRDRLGDGKCV